MIIPDEELEVKIDEFLLSCVLEHERIGVIVPDEEMEVTTDGLPLPWCS